MMKIESTKRSTVSQGRKSHGDLGVDYFGVWARGNLDSSDGLPNLFSLDDLPELRYLLFQPTKLSPPKIAQSTGEPHPPRCKRIFSEA
jgi:hypothetical protein